MSRHIRYRRSWIAGGAVLAIIAGLTGIGARRQMDNAALFQDVLAHIRDYGIDTLDDSTLFVRAARGLVYELNDPYAALYSPRQLADFNRNDLGNAYAGLGLGIERLNDSIMVTEIFPHTPAAVAGVERGDRIVAVDTTLVSGWSTEQVSNYLTGTAGSSVRVTFVRPGVVGPVTDRFARAIVHVPSVPFVLLFDGHVGYVPLLRFNETAAAEVRSALSALRRQGATSFVLDIRGNPGGQLDQALDVSNLFLDRGALLATVRSRAPGRQVYVAGGSPVERAAPTVVLVDEYTASAAEIVAGALQDHDRALIVGMPSFGKGLVQTLGPLDNGWLLKMTTGRWFTPSGRSIHHLRPFENGRFVASDDSAPPGRTAAAIRAGRPTVRSNGGRILYGGGGIVPDVMVLPDSLTTADQHLMAALRPHAAAARAALYGLALDLKHTVSPGFAVRPQWRTMYTARLSAAGITVSPALVDSAGSFVDALIAQRLTEVAFGDSAAGLRGAIRDTQLHRALDLLQRSPDLASLFNAGKHEDS